MIKTIKLLSVLIFCCSFIQRDTKNYEKDLKLNLTTVALPGLSERGVKLSISNQSSSTDYDISVLNTPSLKNCSLYVSFSAFMADGNGKWIKLASKYREASPSDYKLGTKTINLKSGSTEELFSMIMPPQKWFVLSGIGVSIKLVAHYTYKKREEKDTKDENELKIPSFILNSDTVIINMPK